ELFQKVGSIFTHISTLPQFSQMKTPAPSSSTPRSPPVEATCSADRSVEIEIARSISRPYSLVKRQYLTFTFGVFGALPAFNAPTMAKKRELSRLDCRKSTPS